MKAPKVPRVVFRNVKQQPRKFGFKKRYYNPEEEEREARRKEIEREVAMEKGTVDYVPGGKVSFRKYESKGDVYRRASMSANLRLIVILAILIVLAYMAFLYLDKFGG